VGWAMATSLRVELVINALNMALQQRRPTSVIHLELTRFRRRCWG
jgi:hypothetical protein